MAVYENYTGKTQERKKAPAPARYTYTPPTNEQKEREWERQSLERQRAERVEEAAARGAAPVAPPPKQPQTSVYSNPKPTYSNPVGGVTPKPTYSNPVVSKIEKDYPAGFGSPVSLYDQQKPKTYSFQPEIPGENIQYPIKYDISKPESKPKYIPYGEYGSNEFDPWGTTTIYQQYKNPDLKTPDYKSIPITQQTKLESDIKTYMQEWMKINPNASEKQFYEAENLLRRGLEDKYNAQSKVAVAPQTSVTPTAPYVNPLSYLPRTTYQAITQNELLKDLPKLPVSPPYNTGKTPAKETPKNESSSDSGSYPSGSIVTTPSYGQGGKVVVMPPKTGGYTAQELEAAGNRARTDEKYFEGLAYEGYYLAPNGKYYPINYPKAAYAISQGMRNPIQTQYYEGYSKDVDDFIRTFGPEELWRYSPNWKNEGLKYSNPTTTPAPVWNTSNSGSPSGSGNVGGLYSEDPRNRGWYFNPAVNWNT